MRSDFKKAALAALLVAAGINTAAAESVQVKVIGTIIPAACTPTVADGGIVNYGNIKANDLPADSYAQLEERHLEFGIDCDAPARVAIHAINDRPGSLAGAAESANGNGQSPVPLFSAQPSLVGVSGLGLDGTHQIGGYSLNISAGTVTADGVLVDSIENDTNNATGTWTTSMLGSPISTTPRSISWAEAGTMTPVAFTTLRGLMAVQAYINRASELDLSHAVQLDGQTTLEVVYL